MITCNRFMALALVSSLAIVGTEAKSQSPAKAGPTKIYTKKSAFKLPVSIDLNERSRLREVKLFAKCGAGEAWACKMVAPPTQTEFLYHTTKDGEYSFCVVTVDQNGKQVPADLTKESAALIVVVDTHPPECEVRPMTASTGELLFHCDVRDVNPDEKKSKLEYQTSDTKWHALEPHPTKVGCFRVPNLIVPQNLVRATVYDKAGNATTREINLAALSSVSAPEVAVVTSSNKPSLTPASLQVVMPEPKEKVATNVAAPTPALPAAMAAAMQHVNTKHVSVDYQVDQAGPKGIGKVEVWCTHDQSQTWERLCEDPDRTSPVEFDLPGEGVYGITLVVSNGTGMNAAPPIKGDAPDWWVEVDLTKPVAQLISVRSALTKEECGTLLINWTAADKNLKAEPIDLLYAIQKDGPWQPIAKSLKNDGMYRWTVPQGVTGEVYVRMETSDKAGNVTRCDATQGAIMIDGSKPKAHVLGLAGSSTHPAVPAGN